MSISPARPILHMVHLLTFILLFATGLLLFLPGLRASVTGGYSLLIRQAHRWGGVAFAALPVLVVAGFGPARVFIRPAQHTPRTIWQGIHFGITALLGAVLTLTGIVIWKKKIFPEGLVDISRSTHDWLTYVVGILVLLHLLEIGAAAMIDRLRTDPASTTGETEQ